MTPASLKAETAKLVTEWNTAVQAQREVAWQLDILLMKAKDAARATAEQRKAKLKAAKVTPEKWRADLTPDQIECHRADDLDKAFHQASCLAGGWYRAPVVIWTAVVGDDERYWILPEDAPVPTDAEYHRSYRVERIAEDESR